MRIRVTTRAHLFEEPKRQHIERGYRIENERPIPVNGLCSFVAVREMPEDPVAELVQQALRATLVRGQSDWGVQCRSTSAFALMANAADILVTTRGEIDDRLMGSVTDVNSMGREEQDANNCPP